MSLASIIVTKLSQTGAVTALVGTRIYRKGELPQTPILPAVEFFRVSTPREVSHSGDSNLAYPRVQFDCFADKHSEADAVAKAIRQAFDGIDETIGGELLKFGSARGQGDQHDPVLDRHKVILDIKFHHKET